MWHAEYTTSFVLLDYCKFLHRQRLTRKLISFLWRLWTPAWYLIKPDNGRMTGSVDSHFRLTDWVNIPRATGNVHNVGVKKVPKSANKYRLNLYNFRWELNNGLFREFPGITVILMLPIKRGLLRSLGRKKTT